MFENWGNNIFDYVMHLFSNKNVITSKCHSFPLYISENGFSERIFDLKKLSLLSLTQLCLACIIVLLCVTGNKGSISPIHSYLQIRLLSIYKFGLSVCLSVCLFVSNKRQNGWTDRAQIFRGTSRDHREGLWMIKISNICLHQNSILIKFLKI